MKKIIARLEWFLDLGGTKKEITLLILSGIALALSLCGVQPFPFDIAWIAILLCGVPIILEALIGLITAFDIKADVLVSLALIASVCIGEDFAAGEVAFIMQIGALLEDLTVAKARAGIEKLVRLKPQTARKIVDGKEIIISAEEVSVGDILRVLPGETVPADGVITAGNTSVNQAVMTGESLPVDKSVGDEVMSGTVNQYGAFEMRALKAGEDSSIQRMIRLVQSADAGKAKIVGLADRWATWIVVIALAAAGITYFVTGMMIRAVTILVVFCPCALVLATPTAIMAAIGNSAKHGFLVREGDALERLSAVDIVAFDKTGTLTYGKPTVQSVESFSDAYTADEILYFAASAEVMSEHPLGKAIAAYYKEKHGVCGKAEQFLMQPGLGIAAVTDGVNILAGNETLMEKNGLTILPQAAMRAEEMRNDGCSVVYIALNNAFCGIIALSDTVREESADVIDTLHKMQVTPVLLTGDNVHAAKAIAQKVHISKVRASCLPEDKLAFIRDSQANKHRVCMMGDGVNDAPALKCADVGIAMGGIGSDIAVDAADIALTNDEVKELPHLIALSRRMMTTIRLNLTFSMTLNFIAIILAMYGTLNPVVGALVHNAGSVLVIVNSALLLKWRKKK